MAADAFGVVMHDFLPIFVPVMGFVGTLSDANLAVDAQVFVSVNAKLVVVFIDGLEQQDGYLFQFVAKKVIFLLK